MYWEGSGYQWNIQKISIYHEISGYLWNIWISMKYLDIHEIFWCIHEIAGKYPDVSLIRENILIPWNIWISVKYLDILEISEYLWNISVKYLDILEISKYLWNIWWISKSIHIYPYDTYLALYGKYDITNHGEICKKLKYKPWWNTQKIEKTGQKRKEPTETKRANNRVTTRTAEQARC